MLMTAAPGLVRCGYAARVTLEVPIRSMSTTTRKPFEDCALTAATKLPAAPETSTSMGPSWLTALWNARPTASKSRTSAVTPAMLPPVVPSAAMAASTLSCLRLATETFAPCFEKFSATPKPIPVVPPKTSACFPVKSNVSAMVTAPFFQTGSRVHQVGAGERLDLLPHPPEPAGVDDRLAHVGQRPVLLGLGGGRLAMQLDRECRGIPDEDLEDRVEHARVEPGQSGLLEDQLSIDDQRGHRTPSSRSAERMRPQRTGARAESW